MFWAFAACTSLAAASAARLPSSTTPCDLTVLVVARPLAEGGQRPAAQVALSYAQPVQHRRLRAGIEELMARVGASAAEIVIRDTPLVPHADPGEAPQLATAAQFQAPGLVPLSGGMLPVGIIIRALPDWRHMRLIFVVGEQFVFLGPTGAVADGFSLRLLNQPARPGVEVYEYDVERMSERLAPPKGADQPGPGPGPPLLPAALIGVVTGLAAGWLLAGPLSRGSA